MKGHLHFSCLLKAADPTGYIQSQWSYYRKDLSAGKLTDLTLVAAGSGGASSSFKVYCCCLPRYFNENNCLKVHKAVVLPRCQTLSEMLSDIQDDAVIIFPDTSMNVLRAVINYLYEGFFNVSEAQDYVDALEILRSLGIPLSSQVRNITAKCLCSKF